MNPKTMNVSFHYSDLELTPYAHNSNVTSNQIIKNIIQKLQEEAQAGRHFIEDRNKGRTASEKRLLVVLGVTFEARGERVYAKIALIKNKAPYLLSKKFDIDEVENISNKDFVEITNFIIDLRSTKPVMMVEFNSDGPRISDIEFYFRHIGKNFKIAKFCQTKIHVKGEIEEIISRLQNVFHIDLKVRVDKAIYYKDIDSTYFSAITDLKNSYPYKDIKIEMGFGFQKNSSGQYKINMGGISFARKVFDFLSKKTENIDYVEDLKMQIDKGSGVELFDFIKNKEVSELEIEEVSKDRPNNRDLKYKAGIELNAYINHRMK